MKANIKYFNEDMDKIVKIEKGDWLDLRCVGVNKMVIDNSITRSADGLILRRESVKVPILPEKGIFVDGLHQEKVKFFRYSKGDTLLLDLGIAIQLPENCEAHVLPRGSTFKALTVIETNSMGIIDESYKGDGDKWFMPVLAMQDGFIIFNERVCQMKIVEKMEKVEFTELEKFDTADRGSLGSTGIK